MAKRRAGGKAGLLGIALLLGLGGAQGGVGISGGQFLAGRAVGVEVYAPSGTVFRLERVVDPAALLTGTANPSRPKLPPGLVTRAVGSYRPSGGRLQLGRLPSGVYLVRQGQAGAVVVVSHLGLVVKRDRASALVYSADRQSGKTRDAVIWALGTTGPQRSSGGLARFRSLAASQVFVARSGEDWAVSGSNWNAYAAPQWLGHLYSDRPVYRPGQTAEFKGVVRVPGSLRPLAGQAARLTVRDPDGDELLRRTVTTDAYGSVTARLELSAGARPGEYFMELSPAQAPGDAASDVTGSFFVEEYQKPEYAVTLTPSRASAVQGEKVSVRVSARYLFGGAVGGARVTYNVTRAPYSPPGFDEDALPPGTEEGADYGADLALQGVTRLDAAGNLVLTVPLQKDPDGQPARYRIEAEVEDESRRGVSAQTSVIAYPAALNVQTSTSAYIYEVGDPITLSVDTRNLEGQGQAAPVQLELVRQEWLQVRGEWRPRETVVARRAVRTGTGGRAQTRLTAPGGGGYLLRSTVRDARGRASTSENFVWVLGAGEDWAWFSREIDLRLDRRGYAPGDTATVLVTNPNPGAPVLLTLEGERLRSGVVLRGTGSVLTYRFKVTPDMSPNIFVGASALGAGERYSAEARVRVPRPDSALTVQVKPGKARYQPGEAGSFEVRVKDARGQGVGAQVALGVVDQAIYLIRRDAAPTLTQVFTAERSNAVGTETSQDFYFAPFGPQAQAPAAPMTEAAFAQSKAEPPAAQSDGDPTPRENFKDTLLWVPRLTTDAQGRATVRVTFPDNLTTWVATARAQTVSPRFGQASANALVTKDVIARLSLPPFLVRGDTATLAGLANNTLGAPVRGTARMAVQGLTPVGGAAFQAAGAPLSLAGGARTRQDVQVRAAGVGTANATFTVKTDRGSDALKLPLPVKARGYQEARTVVGSAARPSVGFTLPAGTNPQTVRVKVSATPSLLSAVSPALEYLLGYPYGCTEQTMSRFLPALLAREALGPDELPASVRARLGEYVEVGLARLALFQHEDGGWNFWEFDDSTLEMTAYVTEGLLRAKAAGVGMDAGMLGRALTYLRREVKKPGARQAERARAYRVLAQAGGVNEADLLAFARRADLTAYSLAQTALALQQAGQTGAAREALTRLKAKRRVSSGLTHWESPTRGPWITYWDDNSVQVTAAALEALARLEPGSPLIPQASQWLLAQRRGPKWLSTQDTASVVIAALALPRTQAGAVSNLTARLDGRQVGTMRVQGKSASLDLSPDLAPGEHTLTLSGAPPGLTFAAEVAYAREPAQLSGVTGEIDVSRRYEKLTPQWDAKSERYTYRRAPLLKGGALQPVKVGDLLLVTLSVQPKNHAARYLLVSDPIPAGTKALDERSLAIAGLKTPDEYDWERWNYWYSGRDLREDRVDLYADYLAGRQTMTYLLRVQTPGTFTALPTHAFLMYDPDVEGYGPAATLTVRP
ncbi:hypothetical protein SAMN04488058_10946 [Deinococcus reticulitermitis]|uniref:Alpha-2-macroglobulin family N-terminal region n=1 Tax=Deinococcus reticulitermitis TaxID=856736 RepID=A0A1H6Z8P9_9DEIO|nr:MG2 domain-containing protein [Deinococcus reticulitermitis]SEJ49106.1 hypothetical protein SAMN04488058_10946 [Deinococcus reticulitermitis]